MTRGPVLADPAQLLKKSGGEPMSVRTPRHVVEYSLTKVPADQREAASRLLFHTDCHRRSPEDPRGRGEAMIAAVYARVLTATLCLLALATSAVAEGPLVVLWLIVSKPGFDTRGNPVKTFETLAACESALSEWRQTVDYHEREASARVMEATFYAKCLPDAVDPRGPKGK